jgi:hypothetical protein
MTQHHRELEGEGSASRLDKVRFDLLAEYEAKGEVDIASWLSRYPEFRDEIIDFWLFAKGTPRGEYPDNDPPSATEIAIGERALRDACLAVNLGDQWLAPSFDPRSSGDRELARRLEAIRARPLQKVGKAPPAFRKAAVWSWVVSILEEKRERISRLAVQKTSYLLEASMSLGVFKEHEEHMLGPYDYKARYKDAEPIAAKKSWVKIEGTTARTGDRIAEAQQYAIRYLRSAEAARELVLRLAQFSDAELETLATVYWSARTLASQVRPSTVDEIRAAIRAIPKWRPKLRKANFSPESILSALGTLHSFGLVAQP